MKKGVYSYPAYLISIQKCQAGWIPSWNQGCWEKYQQPQRCRWYHPYSRKQRGTKQPLDEGEEESEKAGLKLNIQKIKIMASSPITSWQIDGKTMEIMRDFIFLGSRITGAMKLKDAWSLEEKPWQTETVYLKPETLLCQQSSVWSKLWFSQ